MSVKLKWAKGGFVFRPMYLIPGIFTIYIVHYLDQYGMISLLPQVILGLMGGRWFIKGFYESNNRKFREYQRNQKERRTNRSLLSIMLLFCIVGMSFSGFSVNAGSDYWDLPRELSTEDLDDGWKREIWTNTDNSSVADKTMEIAWDGMEFEDFDNMTLGSTDPEGWEGCLIGAAYNPGLMVITDEHYHSDGQSMSITGQTGGGAVKHDSYANCSPISFWVYFENTVGSFAIQTYSNVADMETGNGIWAMIQFNGITNDIRHCSHDGSSPTWYETGYHFQGGWHHLKLQHNIWNYTYDFWYDDYLIIDDATPYSSQLDLFYTVEVVTLSASQDQTWWIDDYKVGEDAYFRNATWQSQYIMTDAWLIPPYQKDDITLEVTDTMAATGSQCIYINDFNDTDVAKMERYFYPSEAMTFEFDIRFYSSGTPLTDKFYFWGRDEAGWRTVYFYWIESVASGGKFELQYFDGSMIHSLGEYKEEEWHHVKVDVNCTTDSYNLTVDTTEYPDLPFASFNEIDDIASFEFTTSEEYGIEEVYLDNFVFTVDGEEFVNDTFEDDEVGNYPGGDGLDDKHYLNVGYDGVSDTAYIDKIAFIQPDPDNYRKYVEFAVYEKDIVRGPGVLNITEAKLTNGTFSDLNVSTWYFIKIYLVSDGNSTPTVGPIGSQVVFRDLDSFSYEELDIQFAPTWGGSSVPQQDMPWFNQIWLMLEANSTMLLAGLLILMAVIVIAGESGRSRRPRRRRRRR